MARKARVEFEGAVYHVLDRGDRREAIFKDDADRRRFLETLGEAGARTGWRVTACPMRRTTRSKRLTPRPAGGRTTVLSTAARVLIGGLTPGETLWARAGANGSAGASEWSTPTTAMAV